VRDKERLSRAMSGVDYVIHTAALKHVPLCQYNPEEAVKTNILGAMNVIDCAIDNKVKKVIAISSDKAVYPVNIYGSTKLAAEHLFKNAGVYGTTRFACFRPCNFFKSHGNVFELWDEQAKTNLCTLTHEDMWRYYIEIEEAARILLECLDDMKGGEIFIPKCKEYRMLDLLKERYPEIKVKVIGLRQGERLHEPLFSDGEHLIDKDKYWEVI
jgi:UDP-N-acetylglucosamine 4,6-dehydratase/5-epimerase